MACACPPPISPDLRRVLTHWISVAKTNISLQQSRVDQAEFMREVADSIIESVDDFEMSTLHLGDLSATKAYFYQVQQNLDSIRTLTREISNNVAVIHDADTTFFQDNMSRYTQVLKRIAGYTGDDSPAFECLGIITRKFHSHNRIQNERLKTIQDQVSRLTLAKTKFAALKHSLEEQGLI